MMVPIALDATSDDGHAALWPHSGDVSLEFTTRCAIHIRFYPDLPIGLTAHHLGWMLAVYTVRSQ